MPASVLPVASAPLALGRRGQRRAGAALGLSLAVHLAALGLLPDWRRSTPPPPPPMRVTLLPPPQPAPAPAPVAAAAPPPPAPAAPPQATPTPKPVAPRPVLVARQADAPKPTRVTPPAVASEPAPLPAPVASEMPPPAAPPATTSQAAAPHATPGAAAEAGPALDPAALARYGQTLSELLVRQQQYPRLAATRGWEGDVVLKLVIARKGQLVGAQVIRSSGHAVLDESALALVTAAQPFPPVPGQTGGGDLEVTVPVHYQLRKS